MFVSFLSQSSSSPNIIMDILPLKHSQFKSKNYWDSFFSKLKGTKDEYF